MLKIKNREVIVLYIALGILLSEAVGGVLLLFMLGFWSI
jgi:hypothetical protein